MKRLSILLISVLFTFPLVSSAVVGYGGHVTSVVPCPCSGGFNVHFDRLYINSPVPVPGILYYPIGAVLFSFYLPAVPRTWQVGKFVPGTGACMVPIAVGCALVPSLGSIVYLGTSKPSVLPDIPVINTGQGF